VAKAGSTRAQHVEHHTAELEEARGSTRDLRRGEAGARRSALRDVGRDSKGETQAEPAGRGGQRQGRAAVDVGPSPKWALGRGRAAQRGAGPQQGGAEAGLPRRFGQVEQGETIRGALPLDSTGSSSAVQVGAEPPERAGLAHRRQRHAEARVHAEAGRGWPARSAPGRGSRGFRARAASDGDLSAKEGSMKTLTGAGVNGGQARARAA